MSNIRQFLRYHKEYILDETKNRLHSEIQQRKNLTPSSLKKLLKNTESILETVLNQKINSLKKQQLKIALGKRPEFLINRDVLVKEIMQSDGKEAFKQECIEEIQTYVKKLQNESEQIILKEYARRKKEEERKQELEKERSLIVERLEKGDETIEKELRKYISYEVVETFLNIKTDLLYHDVQTVGELMSGIQLKAIKEKCVRKWIIIGVAIIKEEKGKDVFKKTYNNFSSFSYLHVFKKDVIEKRVDEFVELIKKEDFKTIFQEGIKNKPKFMELWRKQRVRRLVGHNKK